MQTFSIVTVTMDAGPGGLRVRCADLPGLALTGTDRRSVADAILPAICALFERQGMSNVVVHPVKPLGDVLAPDAQRRRASDWIEPHRTQFVIETRHAQASAA